MAAQRAPILDLGAGTLAVSGQLQQAGSRLVAGAGRRGIALNAGAPDRARVHHPGREDRGRGARRR